MTWDNATRSAAEPQCIPRGRFRAATLPTISPSITFIRCHTLHTTFNPATPRFAALCIAALLSDNRKRRQRQSVSERVASFQCA
jgi:hypothetical protein